MSYLLSYTDALLTELTARLNAGGVPHAEEQAAFFLEAIKDLLHT